MTLGEQRKVILSQLEELTPEEHDLLTEIRLYKEGLTRKELTKLLACEFE